MSASTTFLVRAGKKRPSIRLVAIAAVAIAATGCGSDSESNPAEVEKRLKGYEKELAGAPEPLAALHEEANELLDGGLPAYEERIAELRGHPIVVNQWASWCGPCRAEFPYFQDQAVEHGQRIAFIGVDAQDNEEAARTFLDELPLPYPSYQDPDQDISRELEVEREFPSTIFYDAAGEIAYVHRGGYQDEADLAADIERYAGS